MIAISRIGLRLVGTSKYIASNNSPKYLQSICHVRNGFSHFIKKSIISGQKESAGYWKMIRDVTKKTLWYSTIPLSTMAVYYTYIYATNPTLFEDLDMALAVNDETLKYSIIPSKIIESSVFFDDGQIEIKTGEDSIFLNNDNTRNLIMSEELDANIQEPFPKGKPIPIKIGKFDGLLDNGKLTLKTKEGETTFTFHNTLSLEVKKTSTILQDQIAAERKEEPTTTLEKHDKFNVIVSNAKTTFKTSNSEKKYTLISNVDKAYLSTTPPSFSELFPIIGNFSFSTEIAVKLQQDDNDEVYHFKNIVNVECEKKVDENLQNEIAAEELPTDYYYLDKKMKTCEVSIDSGTVSFKTKNGEKILVRQVVPLNIFEYGEKTYLMWKPELIMFPVPIIT